MLCPICHKNKEETFFVKKKKQASYYCCDSCDFVFLSTKDYLNEENEFEHYKKHDNQVEDPRYQEFVMPLVDMIQKWTSKEEIALDYGCGPGPVIQHLLEKKGYYQIFLYDLFFKKDEALLERTYDFIILSEVAEHFQKPMESFRSLKKLLKPEGKIFIMTALLDGVKDFASWHYHRDPTHVSFYSIKTFQEITNALDLELLDHDYKKCIVLQNKDYKTSN